jgi:hypothetical protein
MSLRINSNPEDISNAASLKESSQPSISSSPNMLKSPTGGNPELQSKSLFNREVGASSSSSVGSSSSASSVAPSGLNPEVKKQIQVSLSAASQIMGDLAKEMGDIHFSPTMGPSASSLAKIKKSITVVTLKAQAAENDEIVNKQQLPTIKDVQFQTRVLNVAKKLSLMSEASEKNDACKNEIDQALEHLNFVLDTLDSELSQQ